METLQTEHGIFTNNELTKQTAQEVYNEWLGNKDKAMPTTEERLKVAEKATDTYKGDWYEK